MVELAHRVSNLAAFKFHNVRRAVDAWRARNPGRPMVDFVFGDLPWRNEAILAEAKVLADQFPGGYRPPRGEPKVLEAVARELERTDKPGFDPERNICIVNGVIEGSKLATLLLLNPGEKALIPFPHYFLYIDYVAMASGVVQKVETPFQTGFKMTPQQLEAALTPDVKILFLNSPHNPVGFIYSREELIDLARVLARHPQVAIVCDEVYEHVYLDGERPVSLWTVAPQLRDRILIVNSISKCTGLSETRGGWVAGPAEWINPLVQLKRASSWATSRFGQAAILATVSNQEMTERHMETVRVRLRAGRNLMLERLRAMGFPVPNAPAGIFLFPQIPDGLNVPRQDLPGWDEMTLSEQFALHAVEFGVAIVPGIDCGVPNHFRLPFALDEATIQQGMDHLERALRAAR